MSVVLANRCHPDPYNFFGQVPLGSPNAELGFVISAEARDRLLCSYNTDVGTVKYKCNPLGSWGCKPGCAVVPCMKSPPYRTWGCSFLPEDLKKMMQTQTDAYGCGKHGHYNELVFDSWHLPFDPRWAQAVFVQPGMTEANLRRAVTVSETYRQVVGRSIPILLYDARSPEMPFSIYQS